MLWRKFLPLSVFTRKEERYKNNYLCFYLKKWEMTPILAGDKKTSQLIFLWDLCDCEAKPDNDNQAKKRISEFQIISSCDADSNSF